MRSSRFWLSFAAVIIGSSLIPQFVLMGINAAPVIAPAISDWESSEELLQFLEEDPTDTILILTANSDGVVYLNDNCEDYAVQLMNQAQDKGKRLSFVPLNSHEYTKWYNIQIDNSVYHAICGALVGDNEFWYIEPSTDRAWLALYLD